MATTKTTTTKKTENKPTTKKTTTKTETKTTKSSSNNGSIFAWGINKLSMYTIITIALLYAISTVLALCGVNLKIISALQGLATAVMICIVAYLAWKYASKKEMVWKVLYIICLCLVLAGVVIPLIA